MSETERNDRDPRSWPTRLPLLVGTMLLMTLLAGCTASPESGSTDTTDDPILHTSPDDLGNISAEEARNRSHLHDYWGQEDQILVMDETFSRSCRCGDSPFRFDPPANGVIPQGTRWVNVTMSWTNSDESSYTNPHLWIETAADYEPWDAGPIENGETIQIEVTSNTQNDLPHERLSNWGFVLRLEPEDPGALFIFDGEVTVIVDAARGLPLPVFPPHPDLWKGATEIELFSEEDAAGGFYSGNPNSNLGFTWMGPYIPDDGIVVPYDTDHVEVIMEYGDDAPIEVALLFHGAETRDWTTLEPDTSEGKTRTYRITPDMGVPDGPYAVQSNWVFEVSTKDEDPDAFTGSYTLTATAYKDPA